MKAMVPVMLYCATVTSIPVAAQGTAARQIELPTQSMDAALAEVGEIYGVSVIASGAAVRGLTAPAISGVLTAEETLLQLLEKTSLVVIPNDSGDFVIRSEPSTQVPQEAASSTNPSPTITEEIIVTARKLGTQSYRADTSAIGTKTDTPLLETPVSASIVTRAFLDDTQVTTITEALRYVPGISSGDNGRAAVDENITFRGFSFLRSTFVDGLRQQAFNIDVTPEPYGLERVEVLRGPASVLYGSTGPGGIVNSVTRRPERDFSGEATIAAGSLDLLRAGFDVTGSLNRGKTIAGRLTAHIRDQDDFVDSAFNDRVYIAPALSFFPGADTEISLLSSYQQDEFRLAPLVPAEGTVLPSPNGGIDRETFLGEPALPSDEVEMLSATLLLTHTFTDRVSLRHATGVRDYERSGTFIFPSLAAGAREVDRSLSAGPNDATIVSTDTSLSIQFSSGDIEHNVLVGADYYRIDDDSSTEGGVLPPLDAFTPTYTGEFAFTGQLTFDSSTTLDQIGLYVQDQIKIGDRLRITLGGRLDSFEVDFLDEVSGFTILADDDGVFTGRAGLLYLMDIGFAPYVSFAQGFYPQGGVDANGNGFDPDESDQWELGLKYQSTDGRSSASLALFDITRSNLPSPDPENPGFSILTGEQQHRGVELEFNVSVTPQLGVLGSYTYLDAEITQNDTLIGGQPIVGNRPPNVPEHSAAVWAVYSLPQESGLSGLSFSAGVRAQSEREGDTLNTFQTDSYVLFDAGVAYSFDKYRIAVNATNITDEDFVGATPGFSRLVRFGEPRLILASITRAF